MGRVVITQFESGVVWSPQRISAGEAVLALLANTLSARRQPEVVLPVLNKLVSRASLLSVPGVRLGKLRRQSFAWHDPAVSRLEFLSFSSLLIVNW